MSATKFITLDRIKKVEERFAKRWLSGTGPDAKFAEDSQGWYAIFSTYPASMYLGAAKPGLEAGDRVRLTLEKV